MEDSIPSDIPQKQCPTCEGYFDATPEYFYVRSKQTGRLFNQCKSCRQAKDDERYRKKHPPKEEAPIKPTREELDDLYNKQGLNTKQIGKMLGFAHQTIAKWLRKEGLNHQFEKLTREDLDEMYTVEKMTCRQIADKTGFAASSIKNWLREYDIERRPTGAINGLAHRGVTKPNYDELYQWIHAEHKSYEEIGKMFGVTKHTVHQWVEKYNIPGPKVWDTRDRNNRRTKPSREELSALYESGLSLTSIGDIFGYSYGAIGDLCRKYGIEIRPDGWEYKRYLCQDGHLVRSVYEQRVDDWLFAHGIAHTYEPPLGPLNGKRRFMGDFLANGWYIEIWGVTNNEDYKQRSERKRQWYREHNAPLIELPYYLFGERERHRLERRLSQCLSKPIL